MENIKNFTNYMVDNTGDNFRTIWSTKYSKYLKPSLDSRGYYFVYIKNDDGKYYNKRIHRLIAEAYIPNPENKQFIDHINAIRTDNRIENLRWCTLKENNNNPITKKKLSDINKGKKLSEEHKEKISVSINMYWENKRRSNYVG